jgi:hypothetical protein
MRWQNIEARPVRDSVRAVLLSNHQVFFSSISSCGSVRIRFLHVLKIFSLV